MASDLEPLREGSTNERRYAYIYVTAFLLLPILGVGAGAALGLFDPSAFVPENVDTAFVVEYTGYLWVGALAVWTFIQLSRVAGVEFLGGLIDTAQRFLDGYQAPENDDTAKSGSDAAETPSVDDVSDTIDDFDGDA